MFSCSTYTHLTCLPPIFDLNSMHIQSYSPLLNELKYLEILNTLLHVQQYYSNTSRLRVGSTLVSRSKKLGAQNTHEWALLSQSRLNPSLKNGLSCQASTSTCGGAWIAKALSLVLHRQGVCVSQTKKKGGVIATFVSMRGGGICCSTFNEYPPCRTAWKAIL